MKNTSVTTPGRHDHPPHHAVPVLPTESHPDPSHAVRRVGPIDRAALHLGVALIKWGRRPVRQNLQRRHALNSETANARREMDRVRGYNQAMNMTRFR